MSQETQSFEGQEISEFIAAIPAMKLEAPESYQRGTYLTLSVEVRVRSVRYEEVTTGKNKGDLQKVHVLAVENVSVEQTVTPQERLAILEAATAQLVDSEGVAVEVPDGGDIAKATPGSIAEPVIEPVIEDTAEVRNEAWEYEKPEYAIAAASKDIGF